MESSPSIPRAILSLNETKKPSEKISPSQGRNSSCIVQRALEATFLLLRLYAAAVHVAAVDLKKNHANPHHAS